MKIFVILSSLLSFNLLSQTIEFSSGEKIKHENINKNFNQANNMCLIKDYRERTIGQAGTLGGSFENALTWNKRVHTIIKCTKDEFVSFTDSNKNSFELASGKYLISYRSNFNIKGFIKTRIYNEDKNKTEVITATLDLTSENATNSDYVVSSEVDIVDINSSGTDTLSLQYYYKFEVISPAITPADYNLGWDGFFQSASLLDNSELSTNYSTIVIQKVD